MPLLALHIHAEGEDVEVVFDVAKKIFQRFSPDFFRFERKNYLRILFFFFFLSWWKGKFFLKVLVTWPNTSVETAFVFVSRSFLLYFFYRALLKRTQ